MVSALVVACGDDDDDGGNPGTGGTATAGTGGTGNGGTGGTGNGGTGNGGTGGTETGGSGGSAANGGTGGSDPDAGDAGGPCTGCLEVRVSVTDENQLAPFNIDLGGANLADFSDGTVTFRILAANYGDSVGVAGFVNDANFSFQGLQPFTSLNAANDFGTGDFVNVTFDVGDLGLPPNVTDAGVDAGADPDAFDKREVRVIGIQIGTGGGYVPTSDAGPDEIVVFIDSITFSGVNGLANFEFTDDAQNFVLNTFFGHQDATVTHR